MGFGYEIWLRRFLVTVLIAAMLSTSTVNVIVSGELRYGTDNGSEAVGFDGMNKTIETSQASLTKSGNPGRFTWESFLDLFPSDRNARVEWFRRSGADICADEDSAELIIGLDTADSRASTTVANAVAKFGGEIVGNIATRKQTLALVADLPFDVFRLLANELEASGAVRYVEPNTKVRAFMTPNDQYWNVQWGPKKIQADYAWNTTIGSSSTLVAVVDTGIAYNHADLAGNYATGGHDWVNSDNDPMDDHGHGTHCAGIIAAIINNSIGIAGLAQAKVMAEKVLDSDGYGEWDWVANGIIHAADAGADIISMSLGGYGSSTAVQEAVTYAYGLGVLIIAAAGNDNTETKSYPAAYDEVIAVAATDQNDIKAWFSNYGDWIELAAPGVSIQSTVPWGYASWDGTSMACPHVSGTAALIWSQFPNASRDWVRMQLRYTAVDIGTAGFDKFYGYGRINASKAVEPPPAHDLLISGWEKPKFIEPGDSVTFNATIVDFGASNEQNVSVQLLIDGSLTDSTTIDNLVSGTSTTVSLGWSPLIEQTVNVTIYAVPVAGETSVGNNVVTASARVIKVAGFVLFDQTRCQSIDDYGVFVSNLTTSGYLVDPFGETELTPNLLADYDILVIPDAWWEYSEDEVSAIRGFVQGGGGLLVIGDSYPTICTSITAFAGVSWASYFGWQGSTSDITSHEITQGVAAATFGHPMSKLLIGQPAEDIIRGNPPSGDAMVAVAEVDYGRVACVADEYTITDYGINQTDNLVLAKNIVDWLRARTKYEHELFVRLQAPLYLEPDLSETLNATVCNNGMSNETDVELQLFVNGTLVSNATVALLENGTQHTIGYEWTPTEVAVFNVTAYTTPKLGENVTVNNVKTQYVRVQHPLINPIAGQYANYTYSYYDATGTLIGVGSWNFTYDYYVEPYKMHVTLYYQDPSGPSITGPIVVNTMTRMVESGLWAGYWYPGWIETNITLGSAINLLSEIAYINGTEMLVVGARVIECWEVPLLMYGVPYTFWFDKVSGLWIGMHLEASQEEYANLLLSLTNVPLGTEFEHDLGVSLDAPTRVQPNATTTLNATVWNVGLSNETDVTVQILINGTVVRTDSLPMLLNGTSQMIDYAWTPVAEGLYNVTAYASCLPTENMTMNNAETQMIQALLVEVALISDNAEFLSVVRALNEMDVGYDFYSSNVMNLYSENLTLLLTYKVVCLYKDGRSITSDEYTALDAYIRAKGCLLVTGSYSLAGDTLLADIIRSSAIGDDYGEMDLYVANDTHPIVNGPYGIFPSGYHASWLSPECSTAEADTTRGAVTVAELADGYDRIIATDRIPGKVVFWNGDGTSDWASNSDCEAMFKNIIHWFVFRSDHELAVSLTAPKFLEPTNTTTLRATAENLGLSNETNVAVQILINDTLVKNGTAALLPTDGTYAITYSWTVTSAGMYNITAYVVPVDGENITGNNVYSKLVPVQIAQRILSYVMYSDYAGSYRNTLAAMESAFGPAYKVTEFWVHTQLASLLPGRDILLVPNQEQANLGITMSIGSEWSATLTDFVNSGGTAIVCDGGIGAGETYGVLTGAGLMSISDAYSRTNYTLHTTEPNDRLAEGVSPIFIGPYRTTSYQTLEEKAVITDGERPVVVHKCFGGGHVVLLGFDYEDYGADAAQLLGNAVALTAYVTVSTDPTGGAPGTEVLVTGAGATVNGSVAIYWDTTYVASTTANGVGEFAFTLSVPEDATAGMHEIRAVDVTSSKSASALFKVIYASLNPNRGPVGTKVTVDAAGFEPQSQASVMFNDMLIGYAAVDPSGEFSFTFNIPTSAAETQMVKTLDEEGNYAYALFTVVDVTPLDVQVDAGALYFTGEIAEFYVLTALNGEAVNATTVSAMLYRPNGTTETLAVQPMATGLCKIPYATVDSTAGTYTLVVTAAYETETAASDGTAMKSFLLSSTLSGWNAALVGIQADVMAIKTDAGLISVKLDTMNATIASIDEKTLMINTTLGLIKTDIGTVNAMLTALNGAVATIATDLGELETSVDNIGLKIVSVNGTSVALETVLGTLNGTITSIKDNVASIQTDIGEVQTDMSDFQGTQQAWVIPQYVTLVMAAIAAATGVVVLVVFLPRRKIRESKPQ